MSSGGPGQNCDPAGWVASSLWAARLASRGLLGSGDAALQEPSEMTSSGMSCRAQEEEGPAEESKGAIHQKAETGAVESA